MRIAEFLTMSALAMMVCTAGCAQLRQRQARPGASSAVSAPPETHMAAAPSRGETESAEAIQLVNFEAADSTASPTEFAGVSPQAAEATTHDLHAGQLSPEDLMEINLPSALSMVGPRHPTVGLAQWRVQEAYAQLQLARVLWLPTLQTGFSFHLHDGNYQASDGSIVDVHRNSFQYGLGVSATGAGTTPQPGVLAAFHLADAIFQPQIAQREAWARGHAVRSSKNDQLLSVALAYFELLDAVQSHEIVDDALDRTNGLAKITTDYADSGEGLQADADRLQTEVTLARDRLYATAERIETASARLAQALSIHTGQPIRPLDITATPIEMMPKSMDRAELIATGLRCRPELKEAQALVSAACERYRRERNAPFVPSILLGFSTGEFGGGVGTNLGTVESRYDFDAVMTWQLRNLGYGEQAARRGAQARVQQAKYEKVRILDQVAAEVAEAHSQVTYRSKRIEATRNAVERAASSYSLNLSRIRDGQGLPLEVLQSLRALEEAQRAHLRAITEFNQSQFQLHWATGCQLSQ